MRYICLALTCLFLASGVFLTAALPVCDQRAPADFIPRSGLGGVLVALGKGFDQTISRDLGYREAVIQLTKSSTLAQLPGSTTRLPIPCEARESYSPFRGAEVRYSVDRILTSISELLCLLDEGAYDLAAQADLAVRIGFEDIRQSLQNKEEVQVLRYRAYRQLAVKLPLITEQDRENVTAWWSSNFWNSFNDLSLTDSNDATYDNLINGFGTHVVSALDVGGFITVHGGVKYNIWLDKTRNGPAAFTTELLQNLDIAYRELVGSTSTGQ